MIDGIPDFIEAGIASVVTEIAPGFTSRLMGAGNYAIDLMNSPLGQTLFTLYGRSSLGSLGVRVNPSAPKTDSLMYADATTGLTMACEMLRSTGVPAVWDGTSYGTYRTCGDWTEYTRPIITISNTNTYPVLVKISPVVEYESGGLIELTTSTMVYISQFATSML